jgi:NAD(P)-dependent dehydrogenase (short-subunit alcohol dehydrogenase family)
MSDRPPSGDSDATEIVVVIGGSSGIDRATAAAFAARGYLVVITGRRARRLELTADELGPRVSWCAFDATDPAQITDGLRELPTRLNVIVNNAGGDVMLTEPDSEPKVASGEFVEVEDLIASTWERDGRWGLAFRAAKLTAAKPDRAVSSASSSSSSAA